MTTLLFICGHHYAGKTTLANALTSKGFIKLSLSDALRRVCLQMLKDEGFVFDPSIFLEGKDKPWEYPGLATPRDYLKKVGMEMREKDPTWLAEALEETIQGLVREGGDVKVVIDDWRFPHEIQWFIDREYPVKSLRLRREETHPSAEEIRARGVTESFIDTLTVSYEMMVNDGSPPTLTEI